MGRPAKFDRDKAVEIVMNDIWRCGYGACSVKSISEKLGITRSSFYNAFGSREALFKEALELYFKQTPNRVLDNICDDSRIIGTISKMFYDVCAQRAADPDAKGCMAVNCCSELVAVDSVLGPMMAELLINSLDHFEMLLKQAAERGEMEDDGKLREKALALQTLLVGISGMSKISAINTELWPATKQTLMGLGIYCDRYIK